jgi:hypothetical protein
MLVLSFAYAIGRALCRASIHAEFSILAIACSGCQRLCYIAGSRRQVPFALSAEAAARFGFFPKISTPVEKIVEKREFRMGCRGKTPFLA